MPLALSYREATSVDLLAVPVELIRRDATTLPAVHSPSRKEFFKK